MNPNSILLFRSLCLDLDHEYTSSDAVILPVCQQLKTVLTTAVEAVGDSLIEGSAWPSEWFPFKGWGEGEFTFKTWYQIACWPLKIHASDTTHSQEEAYLESFLLNEESCKSWRPDDYAMQIIRLARIVLYRALPQLDLSHEKIQKWYKHGPGAVYEGCYGSDKNYFRVPGGVARHYPEDTFYANSMLAFDCLQGDRITDVEASEGVTPNHAKLTFVPKDHKGPRGVFTHRVATVMVRQAQARALREAFKRGPLRKCYNPEDQVFQQLQALMGSETRLVFTLDLKDASDRIPAKLVRLLLPSHAKALMAARVTHVELPSGSKHILRMFAPMGDPACFDVLSLVCLSVSLSAAALDWVDAGMYGWRSTLRRVEWIEQNCDRIVTVFGDDIAGMVPYYDSVCRGLEAVNLKINWSKSFRYGPFREACGCDALNGDIVTPLRQKSTLERDELVGLIDLHNRVVRQYPGWSRVICVLRRIARRLAKGRIAMTSDYSREPNALQCLEGESPWTWNLFFTKWSFDTSLGELRIRVPGIVVPQEKFCESWDRRWDLSYWLLTRGDSYSAPRYESTRRSVTGSPKADEASRRLWDKTIGQYARTTSRAR